MVKPRKSTIEVQGTAIAVLSYKDEDFISLTDMLKAKDGEFFISDWLRNRNTVEFLGVWESVHNPSFNYGEFAIIKSQAGLNRPQEGVRRQRAAGGFSYSKFSNNCRRRQNLRHPDGERHR